MFDIVILLAGVAERPVLRSPLLGHNPGLTVMAVETREDLAALSLDQLRRAAGPILEVSLFPIPLDIPLLGLGRTGLCASGAVVLAPVEIAGHGSGASAGAADSLGRHEVFPPRLWGHLRHPLRGHRFA